MNQLWLKLWSFYTGNTYIRHIVTTLAALIVVHYATFLSSWAPAADVPFWQIVWTTAISPAIRLVIKWAEGQLTTTAPAGPDA